MIGLDIGSYGTGSKILYTNFSDKLGPVFQSTISLTSLLVVKMLTVLVSTISNSHLFLLKNANAKATHIFSAKILAYMPYLMIKSFNNTLTNDIISFEQLGPGMCKLC